MPTRGRGSQAIDQPARQYTIHWEYSQLHLYFYSSHQIESEIRFFHQSIELLLFLFQASSKFAQGGTSGLSIFISFHWVPGRKCLVSIFYLQSKGHIFKVDGSSFKEQEGEQLVGSPADSQQLEAHQRCQIWCPDTNPNVSKDQMFASSFTTWGGFRGTQQSDCADGTTFS